MKNEIIIFIDYSTFFWAIARNPKCTWHAESKWYNSAENFVTLARPIFFCASEARRVLTEWEEENEITAWSASFICGSRRSLPGRTLQSEHLLPTAKLALELISIQSRTSRGLRRTVRLWRISCHFVYAMAQQYLTYLTYRQRALS